MCDCVEIKPMALFGTPKSYKEIQDWIKSWPPEDRVALTMASALTWNYLASVTKPKCKKSDMEESEEVSS